MEGGRWQPWGLRIIYIYIKIKIASHVLRAAQETPPPSHRRNLGRSCSPQRIPIKTNMTKADVDSWLIPCRSRIDAVVEELREDSAEVTEQTVLGTVVDEVQGKLPVVAPEFYNIVKTAAWSERQEEQNSHKDPTKASSYLSFALSSCSNGPLHSASRLSSVRSLFRGISVPTRSTAQSHYT